MRIIEEDSKVFIPLEFRTLCEYFGRGFGGIETSYYYSYESMKSMKSSYGSKVLWQVRQYRVWWRHFQLYRMDNTSEDGNKEEEQGGARFGHNYGSYKSVEMGWAFLTHLTFNTCRVKNEF